MNRFKSILANTGYFTIGIGVIAGELAISGYDRVAKACDRCVDKGKDAVHPVRDSSRVSVRADML
tara:strand:+ start:31 stop:225 length:195 start_codon:yes stop_codon:yes gene_type:complete